MAALVRMIVPAPVLLKPAVPASEDPIVAVTPASARTLDSVSVKVEPVTV